MCLLAVHIGFSPTAPILLAANREEAYARPSRPPEVYEGSPSVMCGTDVTVGGTWLGVNGQGGVVAVTNRPQPSRVPQPRSRGLLCRELLSCESASEAAELAVRELSTGGYLGANFLMADAKGGFIVHGGEQLETLELEPGLHLLTNGDANDPNDPRQATARAMLTEARYATVQEFVAAAKNVCAFNDDAAKSTDLKRASSIIIRRPERGTVSSSIITLSQSPAECHYFFAPGPPDTEDYADMSDSLRLLLGGAH